MDLNARSRFDIFSLINSRRLIPVNARKQTAIVRKPRALDLFTRGQLLLEFSFQSLLVTDGIACEIITRDRVVLDGGNSRCNTR